METTIVYWGYIGIEAHSRETVGNYLAIVWLSKNVRPA